MICPCNKKILCLVTVSQQDSYTGQERQAWKEIDKCLVDKVNKLNRQGRLTRSSCCGHGKVRSSIILQDGTILTDVI